MYSVLQKEIWKRILYLYFFLHQDQLLFLQSPSLALFHSGCRHPERHYELSFMANYNTAVQRFRVRHGLSCVIGPVWPVGAGCYSPAALPMPLSKPLYFIQICATHKKVNRASFHSNMMGSSTIPAHGTEHSPIKGMAHLGVQLRTRIVHQKWQHGATAHMIVR